MRYIPAPDATSAGDSRYWSSGPDPALGATPVAGALEVPTGPDGGADGGADATADGGDTGSGLDGAADAELDVAPTAAADPELWCRPSTTAMPAPEIASTMTTITATTQIIERDLLGVFACPGGMYGGPM
jgi:hypothetical protein